MQRSSGKAAARREALIATIQRALAAAGATETVACTASSILTRGIEHELFVGAPTEDNEALMAAVLAFAERAPHGYLKLMAERAEREIAWAKWWVERGYAEMIGTVPTLGYDFNTMRAGVAA